MRPANRRSNQDWAEALSGTGRAEALADLRAFLVAGLRRALASRTGVAEGLVEDFAQDALIKILERRESFRGESRFTTWALAIAIRVAYSELRRRRWKDVSLDAALEGIEFRPTDLVEGSRLPDARVVRSEVLSVLERVLDQSLSRRQRKAILAEYVAEMPMEEVARRMGTNRNALYKLLHDGRRRLKSELLRAGFTWEQIQSAFDF